ncbi:hypothetical protein [Okeania sp. SIO2B3]|uniref:hypothetical protein n=1 Tax=Okeania sp. SIO2B3 TaxID=2607784 RepID=UPI0013C0CB90|nr:hypothetical protein [Okeania sp. SIO2B3]NET44873.1 hypothetical protein [Okeania sp. SIO2B3]
MKISELLARYELKSRAALYNRRKALGIEFAKDENDRAFASKEQVDMLDDLHGHLQGGGRLSNYSPVHDAHVISVSPVDSRSSNEYSVEQYSGCSELSSEQRRQTSSIELLEKLVGAIATTIQPVSPVIKRHQQLQQAAENGWLLTSKDVQAITGRKPTRKGSDLCQIGGWLFISVGKSGNQLLWKAEKLNL